MAALNVWLILSPTQVNPPCSLSLRVLRVEPALRCICDVFVLYLRCVSVVSVRYVFVRYLGTVGCICVVFHVFVLYMQCICVVSLQFLLHSNCIWCICIAYVMHFYYIPYRCFASANVLLYPTFSYTIYDVFVLCCISLVYLSYLSSI